MIVTIIEEDPCLEYTSNPEHITEDIIQSPCKAGLFPAFGFSPIFLKSCMPLRPGCGLFLSFAGNCTEGPAGAPHERRAQLTTLETCIPVRCCLDTPLPCSFKFSGKDTRVSGWVQFIEIRCLERPLIPENLNMRAWNTVV